MSFGNRAEESNINASWLPYEVVCMRLFTTVVQQMQKAKCKKYNKRGNKIKDE